MTRVTRREFIILLQQLSASGFLPQATHAAILAEQQESGSDDQEGEQNEADVHVPSEAQGPLMEAVSDYVASLTRSINASIASLASKTYTASLSAGGQIEAGTFRYEANGGLVVSFNFSTGDYAHGNFSTTAPGSSSTAQLSVGVGLGAIVGVGDVNSFLGKSTVASAPVSPAVSLGFSYNDGFQGVAVSVGGSYGASGAGFTEESETKPQGIDVGNVYNDLSSIEATLWNMSQDPLTGSFH